MSLAEAPEGRLAWEGARLAAREAVTARVELFRFTVGWRRPHRAGQHVELRLEAPDGYGARRRYSIASAPAQRGAIDLLVARAAAGEVSGFLHDALRPGDAVDLRGPIGGPFSWAPEDGGPLLLVGGGLGVAPLLAMVRERAAAAPALPVALLYAARSRGDAPCLTELEGRARTEPGFALVPALSREPGGCRLGAPAIAEALGCLPAPPRRTFVCGSSAFVSAATDLLLDAGLAAEAIRTERFG